MRTAGRCLVLVLGLIVGLRSATVARAANITVSPSSVAVGGTVTVSGDVLAPGGQPGCALPGTVLLFSGAFGDLNTPVMAAAGADAHFSVQVMIPAGVAPGSYTITGRCGGGNLGVQATLTVTPVLPSTGSDGLIGARPTEWLTVSLVIVLGLALSGAALLTADRRCDESP